MIFKFKKRNDIYSIYLIFFILVLFFSACKKDLNNQSDTIKIALIDYSYSSYTIKIAAEKKIFKSNNLKEILLENYNNGKETLDAICNGEADIAVCTETPFINAVLDGNDIVTFATTITAYNHLGIIARKDRDIKKPEDLKNKKIGITLNSNAEYFLDLILELYHIPKESLELINLKPFKLIDAIFAGETDAVVCWNPIKNYIFNKLKEKVILIDAKGIYSPYFIVCATRKFVEKNPMIIEKLVSILVDSTNYIIKNQDECNSILLDFFKLSDDKVSKINATYLFQISLDQSLILTMEDQSKWAIKNHSNRKNINPNYLNYIYIDALKKVSPINLTIIK